MKVDRAKRHRRIMQFYIQNFHFKAPFRIIMDYEFIAHMLEKKLGNPKEFFPKLFGQKAYPMVTECMLKEAQSNKSSDSEVLRAMSMYEKAPCGHQGATISGEECLRQAFAAPRYCLAGRSKWTMKMAYHFPHVIVVMWDPQNVLVLRAPSEMSKASAEREMEGKRIHAGDVEKEMTKQAILEEKKERAERNMELSKKIAYNMRFHHKPVAKGPNPLSMMKKMSAEEKARHRAILAKSNPFRQFGGEASSDTRHSDPSFLSRSKLRRKRQRSELSLLKSSSSSPSSPPPQSFSLSSHIETGNPTLDSSAPSPSPTPSDTPSRTEKKIRKRRKPREVSGDDNSIHKLRTSDMQRDSAAEAKAHLSS